MTGLQRGLLGSFLDEEFRWSGGVMQNIKFQAPNLRMSGVPPEADQVSGVRCQVSGKRNKKAEACWSEAEIPSEAKRQRGTLKPETHN